MGYMIGCVEFWEFIWLNISVRIQRTQTHYERSNIAAAPDNNISHDQWFEISSVVAADVVSCQVRFVLGEIVDNKLMKKQHVASCWDCGFMLGEEQVL